MSAERLIAALRAPPVATPPRRSPQPIVRLGLRLAKGLFDVVLPVDLLREPAALVGARTCPRWLSGCAPLDSPRFGLTDRSLEAPHFHHRGRLLHRHRALTRPVVQGCSRSRQFIWPDEPTSVQGCVEDFKIDHLQTIVEEQAERMIKRFPPALLQ